MAGTSRGGVPIEFVFNPNWWFRNYGIAFDRSFYFDHARRIENDVKMRRALHERFGLGEAAPEPRPVIGSEFVAGGFVVPALLGVEIRFAEDQAPCPVPADMSRERIFELKVPPLESTWPMSALIAGMDRLEKEFGYITGDFDPDGVFNTALHLRGQQLFIDLIEDPELVEHLFTVVAETQARTAEYVRARTGTSSLSVNRSIRNVDSKIFLSSNCSVQMISPALYEKTLLEHECRLAARLRPWGIHHCGDNLHLFTRYYARTGAVFYDVGWGSAVARCAAALPGAFLNLRLSPVRALQVGAAEMREDAERLLASAGRKDNLGLCCINMDHGTPEANVLAMIEAARSFPSPA